MKPFKRLAILLAVAVIGPLLLPPAPAQAASVKLHGLTFNACDQFGRGNSQCPQPWYERSSAIAASITDWDARAVMLQEVCETTYNDILYDELGGSGAGWTGVFVTTYAVPTNDVRCRSQGGGNWGLAIFARGAAFTSANGMIIGQNPTGAEVRRLLCANTTIAGIGFRVCSSHLTRLTTQAERDANRSQFNNLRVEINSRAYDGQALALGADLNRNSRNCTTIDDLSLLDDIHRGTYGGATFSSRCATFGSGPYYEADNTGTDTAYNESTFDDLKLDYFLMNYQRFYGSYGADATSSIYSDHDPLRTSFTVNG